MKNPVGCRFHGTGEGAMPQNFELRLAELIAARMSHDLVGPVGASVNGVELLAEDGAGDPDVVGMIGQAARQASRRLQVFRAIYGTPGALPAGAPFAAAHKLFAAFLEGDKAVLSAWNAAPALEAEGGRSGARIALLAGFVLSEALPRGGNLSFEGAFAAGRAQLEWRAEGTGARLFEEVEATLAGKVALGELTPKAAPAAVLQCLVAELGGDLAYVPKKDALTLAMAFQAPGDA
jgi:histidine phosphotransferase ChpT